MQRLQARVRIRFGCGVELGFEERDELVRGFGVGQRLAGRRHHATAELLDDGLPDLGVRADVAQRETLERELAGALRVVVAIGAVLVEDVLSRGRALFDARLTSGGQQGEGCNGEGTHNPKNLPGKKLPGVGARVKNSGVGVGLARLRRRLGGGFEGVVRSTRPRRTPRRCSS